MCEGVEVNQYIRLVAEQICFSKQEKVSLVVFLRNNCENCQSEKNRAIAWLNSTRSINIWR